MQALARAMVLPPSRPSLCQRPATNSIERDGGRVETRSFYPRPPVVTYEAIAVDCGDFSQTRPVSLSSTAALLKAGRTTNLSDTGSAGPTESVAYPWPSRSSCSLRRHYCSYYKYGQDSVELSRQPLNAGEIYVGNPLMRDSRRMNHVG